MMQEVPFVAEATARSLGLAKLHEDHLDDALEGLEDAGAIGSDGANSRLRDLVTPIRPTYVGVSLVEAVLPAAK